MARWPGDNFKLNRALNRLRLLSGRAIMNKETTCLHHMQLALLDEAPRYHRKIPARVVRGSPTASFGVPMKHLQSCKPNPGREAVSRCHLEGHRRGTASCQRHCPLTGAGQPEPELQVGTYQQSGL